jgi:amino acid transporter
MPSLSATGLSQPDLAHHPSKPAGKRSSGKLRLIPLVAATYFMVSGGPYGIEDILGGAGYLGALAILIVLPFIWSLPTALMIGELASALPEEGGFYVWVRHAFGPFWGYQEAWLSLTASVFDMAIYPAISVLYLTKLAPSWTAGHRGVFWAVTVVVLCCLWNLGGARSVGRGAVSLFLLLLFPFAILVGAGYWAGWLRFLHHAPPMAHISPEGSFTTAVLVAMWNYMGWDNASTVAQEVDNPRRNYPLAMITTTAVVALSYVIPLSAIAAAGIPVSQFSTGSWVDAARILAGPALGIAIVFGGIINGFGMFNSLVLSYTRLPVVLAEDGMMPASLALRNKRASPWVSILLCGLAWALALSFTFERLISIDLMLYGVSLVLEFAALIALRIWKPEMNRPFRIPGGTVVACLVSAGPVLLIGYAIYTARTERLAHMPAILFGFIIAACGPLFYWFSKKLWSHKHPDALKDLSS